MQRNERMNGFCLEKLECNDEMMQGVIPANRLFDFNTLIGMGFGKDVSVNAIHKSTNLDSAVDSILNRELRGKKDGTMESVQSEDVTVTSGNGILGNGQINAGGRVFDTYFVEV